MPIAEGPLPREQLYLRSWKVAINTTLFQNIAGSSGVPGLGGAGFEGQFTIRKHNRPQPNTGELRIFNLPKQTRDRLEAEFNAFQAKPLEVKLQERTVLLSPRLLGEQTPQGPFGRVRIEAGYGANTEVITESDIVDLQNVQNGSATTWETRVKFADGWVPWRDGFANVSFAGAQAVAIAEDLARILGSELSDLSKAEIEKESARINRQQVTTSLVYRGPARDAIVTFLDAMNLTPTFQNGELVVVPNDRSIDDFAVVMSPDSGLLRPLLARKRSRFLARSLLVPKLIPGRQVFLRDANQQPIGNHTYRVDLVTHTGSFTSNNWWSTCELRPTTAAGQVIEVP